MDAFFHLCTVYYLLILCIIFFLLYIHLSFSLYEFCIIIFDWLIDWLILTFSFLLTDWMKYVLYFDRLLLLLLLWLRPVSRRCSTCPMGLRSTPGFPVVKLIWHPGTGLTGWRWVSFSLLWPKAKAVWDLSIIKMNLACRLIFPTRWWLRRSSFT